MSQPHLSTGHYYLRAPEPADVPDISLACAEPGFTRWTRLPAVYVPEHAAAFVRRDRSTRPDWMVLDAVSGRVSGWVGLFLDGSDPGSAEIGYWTAPWSAGRGTASEAVAAVTGYAFGGLGLTRLALRHAVPNAASCAVARRCGFAVEGVQRGGWFKDGERADLELHGRLAAD